MELLYKDLSYQVIGVLYKVYNQLGYGYKERQYQRAIAAELNSLKIKYEKELYSDLFFQGQKIAGFFIDFLIDKKIVLEIKVANKVYKKHLNQVLEYLKNNSIKLAIIGIFTPDGILIKRIIN